MVPGQTLLETLEAPDLMLSQTVVGPPIEVMLSLTFPDIEDAAYEEPDRCISTAMLISEVASKNSSEN